jgi:hypothetical protein
MVETAAETISSSPKDWVRESYHACEAAGRAKSSHHDENPL